MSTPLRKACITIPAGGTLLSHVVKHGFGTKDVMVQAFWEDSGIEVGPDVYEIYREKDKVQIAFLSDVQPEDIRIVVIG